MEEGCEGRQARQAGPRADELNHASRSQPGPVRVAPEAAALAAIALVVGTWAIGTARYGGPDEPAHVIRAAAVARGEVLGATTDALAPGFRVVTVPAELATGDPICFRRAPTKHAACSAAEHVPGTIRAATAAGVYPPAYYALVGVPARIGGGGSSSSAHRAVAAVLVVGVLALVARRAKRLGGHSLLVLAGVPPAAWFLFGVVNPNAVEIALVLLSWVGVALVDRDRARPRDLAWISVPAAVAVMTRPVALLPACAIAAATSALVERSTWRNRLALWGPLAVAAATVVAWNRAVALEFDDPRTARAAGVLDATWRALKDVPATLSEAVGALSWTEVSAPWAARVLSALVAVTLLTTACLLGSSRLRLALGAWLVVLVLGPVAFEVLTHHRIGFIWQGRYSISTLVGVGPLAARAAWTEFRRRAADPSSGGMPTFSSARVVGSDFVASTLVAMAALAEAAAFWTLLRRYTVGTNGSWWFAGELGWAPAVHPRVLLGVHLGVLACVLATSVAATRTPTGRSTRRRR